MMYRLTCMTNKKFGDVFLESYASLLKQLSEDAPNKIVSRSYLDMADLLVDTYDENANVIRILPHRMCASLLSTLEGAVKKTGGFTLSETYMLVADGIGAVVALLNGEDGRFNDATICTDGWAYWQYEVDEGLLA